MRVVIWRLERYTQSITTPWAEGITPSRGSRSPEPTAALQITSHCCVCIDCWASAWSALHAFGYMYGMADQKATAVPAPAHMIARDLVLSVNVNAPDPTTVCRGSFGSGIPATVCLPSRRIRAWTDTPCRLPAASPRAKCGSRPHVTAHHGMLLVICLPEKLGSGPCFSLSHHFV